MEPLSRQAQRTLQPKVLSTRQAKERKVKRTIMAKARPRSNIVGFTTMDGVIPHRLAGSPMPVARVDASDKACGTWGSAGKTKDSTKGRGKVAKGADKGKGKGKKDKGKS